jgi:ABC-type multidrug transport system fused ATPase/permease subunit
MARYYDSCSYPIRTHDPSCPHCHVTLLQEEEAKAARERWESLSELNRQEFEAEYDRRIREWKKSYDFYERKAPLKHMLAGAAVFGLAGALSGIMAVAYALAGLLGGRIISRRKGGIFLGTIVGAVLFMVILIIRLLIALMLPVEGVTLLLNAVSTHYADRFIGLLCPAAGGLLGYLIEQEYEQSG